MITELNNSTESLEIKLDHAEEKISDLENSTLEMIQSDKQKGKQMRKSEENR